MELLNIESSQGLVLQMGLGLSKISCKPLLRGSILDFGWNWIEKELMRRVKDFSKLGLGFLTRGICFALFDITRGSIAVLEVD